MTRLIVVSETVWLNWVTLLSLPGTAVSGSVAWERSAEPHRRNTTASSVPGYRLPSGQMLFRPQAVQ